MSSITSKSRTISKLAQKLIKSHESNYEYNIQNTQQNWYVRIMNTHMQWTTQWQLYSTILHPLNKSASASLTEMYGIRPESYFQNKHYWLPVSFAKAPTVRGSHCGGFLKFQQSTQTHCASHWQGQCSWKLVWGANQWVKLCGYWEPPQNIFQFLPVLALKSHSPTTHPLETET